MQEHLNPDPWITEEMIMLIQHTEKKENSSSKRYETGKWSVGDAILVTDC